MSFWMEYRSLFDATKSDIEVDKDGGFEVE
jgi:hypothetical protein